MPFTHGTTLHVLRCNLGVKDMLNLEEALLRADTRNWLLLTRGPPIPTIILGVSGKLHSLVNVASARAAGAHAYRRFTGGGTVVCDEGTQFVSLCLSKGAATGSPLYPKEIMAWSQGLYAPVITALLAGTPAPPFTMGEHDYCLGDVKFGGNAQAVSRERWVHHTSFLWRYSPAHMALLKIPEKRPAYRRDRAHGDFLVGLGHYLPPNTPPSALEDALLSHLKGLPGLTTVNATLEDAMEALPRNERRSNEDVELV
jgi:lipoate-protein ligase A